jgi:hypothetical protein
MAIHMNVRRNLHDTVTYWQSNGTDRFGKTTFTAPVQLQARWEDDMQQIQGKDGDVTVAKSRVYLADSVSLDCYLFKGTSVEASPLGLAGAHEIQNVGQSPDLRSASNLWVAYL